jgi:ketosteroid isomerase-like protein
MSRKMGPNERLLREVYQAYTQGQVDHIYETLSPDVTWFVAGDPKIQPYTGVFRGETGIRDFFGLMRREWAIESYVVEDVVAQDDERFVVRSISRARNLQTGRTTNFWKLDVVVMKDGKLLSYAEYNDTGALLACMPEGLAEKRQIAWSQGPIG